MDSVRFCTWAPLLRFYPGALSARLAAERPAPPPAPVYEAAPVRHLGPAGATEIPSTPAAVKMSPMGDLFSFATAGGGV